MNNPMQHRSWLRGTHARAASTARPLIVLLVLVAAALPAQAQGYAEAVLHSFTGGTDGALPYSGLVLDAQGNMYGTTATGGNLADCSGNGCGTVFMMDPLGNETVLYTFTGSYGGSSVLVLDPQGNLYGTTASGGTYDFGTVFKVDAGNQTTLYNFTGAKGDGITPIGGLVPDGLGNFYGTTDAGGIRTQCSGSGCGTVFRVDAEWNEQVLYSFVGINPYKADGSEPKAGLVLDALGNLYGTTAGGGNRACGVGVTNYGGCGTVFKLDATGNETVLYAFTGGADGENPAAGLVMDAQGNLYGAANGGAAGGGTVFKLDTTGQLTVLHSFPEKAWDGTGPGGLVLDAQGNLYGTTIEGGIHSSGTVFKLDSTGKETVLHIFATAAGDGSLPSGGLVLDAEGNLYGTTEGGGTRHNNSSGGTVFKLKPAPPTTTTLTSSRNPLMYGNALTFSATVTSPAGGIPTGQVYFYDSNFAGGTAPMFAIALNSSGLARFKTPGWPLGSNSVTAIYVGDSNYSSSISAPFVQVVEVATTIALTSSQNPSVYGQAVTFTADVGSTLRRPPPDGETVTFMNGKKILGTGSLSSGTATFITSTLKVGTTAVTAVYGGDGDFAGKKSNAIKQVVEKSEQ